MAECCRSLTEAVAVLVCSVLPGDREGGGGSVLGGVMSSELCPTFFKDRTIHQFRDKLKDNEA